MFSVADEDEAALLLTMTCPTNARDQWVAVELSEEQNLDNLARFSHRLAVAHDHMKERGTCRCTT